MTDAPRVTSALYWTPARPLRWLLVWTSLTTVIFWLPVVRGAFDGPSYSWGLFGFAGKGLSGDYWFSCLGAVFALTLLFLSWRRGGPLSLALLALWHVGLVLGVIYWAWSDPEGFVIQGDTMGMEISLAWLGPILFAVPAAAAVWLLWREARRDLLLQRAPLGRRNKRWLWMLLALLPIQFVLLHWGEPLGTMDQVGVLLTVAQWLLVGTALRPRV